MTRHHIVLPQGVRTETFTHANGERQTVYLAPVAAEGPLRFADGSGNRLLVFMYDYFVFVWKAETATVDVLHGRATALRQNGDSNTIVLYRNVAIEGEWAPENLRRFGVGRVRRRRSERG